MIESIVDRIIPPILAAVLLLAGSATAEEPAPPADAPGDETTAAEVPGQEEPFTQTVELFQLDFDDALSLEIQVNAEFDSVSAADFADLYARRLGVLPNVLREDVASISIHDGDEGFRAIDTGLIVPAGQGEQYRLQGFLEEVLAHEAVHVSLDADHASSPGWLAAQASDPTFISGFARDFPQDEDLAETFGAWLAARWAGDGITDFLRALIQNAVPARLDYLDAQGFLMHPVVD